MTKNLVSAATAQAFKGAPTADKAAAKGDSVVVHVSFGKDKEEDFRLDRNVYGLLRSGMEQAEKVVAYWKSNAQTIGAAFWDLTQFEGEARAVILRDLRGKKGEENGKPYARLFASLVQATGYWQKKLTADQRMSNHEKGSPEYDDAKRLSNSYARDAQGVAGQQCRAILGHLADQLSGQDKESGEREQKSARQLIEGTVTDWAALIVAGRGLFALPAERQLLGDAVQALREVLARSLKAANPQSIFTPVPSDDGDPINPAPKVQPLNTGLPTKGTAKTVKAAKAKVPA